MSLEQIEKQSMVSQEQPFEDAQTDVRQTPTTSGSEFLEKNTSDAGSSITSQPKPSQEMQLAPDTASDFGPRSSYTLSQEGSGYERDQNECTEFCLDFSSCFGLFDACCPADSEGCMTTCAVFIGNLFFSCCQC
ncbi:hypothetical protein CANTEDRAFT_116117, partial [Yamadazyma tenuis ATCC 10573]